jgi:hypothetical protein
MPWFVTHPFPCLACDEYRCGAEEPPQLNPAFGIWERSVDGPDRRKIRRHTALCLCTRGPFSQDWPSCLASPASPPNTRAIVDTDFMALLFKKESWSLFWILVRRAPRDHRARIALLRLLLAGLVILAVVVDYGILIRLLLSDSVGPILALSLLGVAMFFFARKWTERYELIQLNRNLPPDRNLPPAEDVDVKSAIFHEASWLAALLRRSGSERAMEKGVAPGMEVITRRVILEELRSRNLLDGLDSHIRDLLSAPDGSWSGEQKRVTRSCWEFLVVLRWALGLDADLRSISLSPEYRAEMASGITKTSNSRKLRMLPPWEMRIERDRASNLLVRCQVELAARGEWTEATLEAQQDAKRIKADIDTSSDQGDLLVGVRTVSELDRQALWDCALRSYRRQQMLRLLVEVSGGDLPVSALHSFLMEHITAGGPTVTDDGASNVAGSLE